MSTVVDRIRDTMNFGAAQIRTPLRADDLEARAARPDRRCEFCKHHVKATPAPIDYPMAFAVCRAPRNRLYTFCTTVRDNDMACGRRGAWWEHR